MQLEIPAHDCLVSGLGMYAEHKSSNPLAESSSASSLLDEHILFYFARETGNEQLNLDMGMHFPVLVGQLCKKKKVYLQKPKEMSEILIALQHGYAISFIILSEEKSNGIHMLQLNVGVHSKDDPRTVFHMPPHTLHRFIRSE